MRVTDVSWEAAAPENCAGRHQSAVGPAAEPCWIWPTYARDVLPSASSATQRFQEF